MNDTLRTEQAKEQGRQAFRLGKPVGANPYRGDTTLVRSLSQAFRQGWEEARSAKRAKL